MTRLLVLIFFIVGTELSTSLDCYSCSYPDTGSTGGTCKGTVDETTVNLTCPEVANTHCQTTYVKVAGEYTLVTRACFPGCTASPDVGAGGIKCCQENLCNGNINGGNIKDWHLVFKLTIPAALLLTVTTYL